MNDYPLVWFEEDSRGGWSELLTKLKQFNLVFIGSRMESWNRSCPDQIVDLAALCRQQGGVLINIPVRALTYTQLICELQRLRLVN